jgi:hypothetical protein
MLAQLSRETGRAPNPRSSRKRLRHTRGISRKRRGLGVFGELPPEPSHRPTVGRPVLHDVTPRGRGRWRRAVGSRRARR